MLLGDPFDVIAVSRILRTGRPLDEFDGADVVAAILPAMGPRHTGIYAALRRGHGLGEEEAETVVRSLEAAHRQRARDLRCSNPSDCPLCAEED